MSLKFSIFHSPFSILLFCFSAFSLSAQKYIFYFIGDGFGIGALTYCEKMAMEKGDTLCFTQFPVTGFITTHSADNLVTCSAAAATALASGEKTKNGMLNFSPDSKRKLLPISKTLHQKGFSVGIATSVSIDHATPAGFYAHSTSRSDYYDIAKQLTVSGFEFFGGSGFLQPEPAGFVSIFKLLKDNHYTVSTSMQQCSESQSIKNVLVQPQGKSAKQLPFAIYKDKTDFTLPQITQLGIEKLYALEKPFFFMVEGGLIDWAAHDNLTKELYGEVKEFSEAIKVALNFYEQHTEDTLIIVTSDHETGGIFAVTKGIRFYSKDHTGNIVPLFAIGKGAENFSGLHDNTQISKKILELTP